MKRSFTVTAIVVFLFAFSGKLLCEEAIDYPVREIDPESNKFARVYSEVVYAMELERAKSKTTSRVRIIQNISKGLYLASVGDSTYAFIHPGRILVDGEELNIQVVKTGQVHQYVSVLGAKKTVEVIKKSVDEMMSKDEFLRRLKNGETFTLPLKTGERGCPNCYGRGRTGGWLNGPPAITCEKCGGRKKIPIIKKFRVRW